MKKQIRFLGMLFLITCLFGMLSVSYAEQFDTNIVSRDVKPGGSSTEDLYKYWAYYKNTGTRYVFRVYDWNSKQYIAVPKELLDKWNEIKSAVGGNQTAYIVSLIEKDLNENYDRYKQIADLQNSIGVKSE